MYLGIIVTLPLRRDLEEGLKVNGVLPVLRDRSKWSTSGGWTLVRTRSIFPWLVRVVSDRSVRYNEKHLAALPEIKSDFNGTSFQSSPKINRMLIARSVCIQHPTIAVLLITVFLHHDTFPKIYIADLLISRT